MPASIIKENVMPKLIDILTEDLVRAAARHGPDAWSVQQLQRQIDALKFQETRAGTRQQEEVFGACFSPCDNSE